ncbi:MAG: 4-hydroxythreonine-4-phosphate dehydrogenase PdxA [Bdellovibrionales bacterium]|nr:4-hydroxythreonine-4-phosphate dehydrogenase PdxA [Bdellovibrionales bacterium]
MSIAITCGDPFGIGPEILIKASKEMGKDFPSSCIYGNEQLFEETCDLLGIKKFWSKNGPIHFKECFAYIENQNCHIERARAVLATLDAAIQDCINKERKNLVTCPIDKSIVRNLDTEFLGHTEYLAKKNHKDQTVMLLDNGDFRVALITGHIALCEVSSQITKDNIKKILAIALPSLSTHFSIQKPRIALLGVNPHAGELQKRSEEETVIKPLIEELQQQAVDIEGPFPADSFFSHHKGQFDLVLSPYHDQGLVAIKYPGLDKVVNTTLGLDFVRTSPGHGVAYDLYGQGKANPKSLIRAIQIAQHQSITKN